MAMSRKPGRDHERERDQAVPEGARRLAPPIEPVGEVEHDRQLRELGRLQRAEAGDHDPAPRSVDLGADAGDEHGDQQRQRDDEDRDGEVAQVPEVDAAGDEQADQADAGPHDLLHPLRRRVRAVEVRAHARRRVHHHDADGAERHHGQQERVGRIVPLAAHAAARRGAAAGHRGRRGAHRSLSSDSTAARNASPRSA